MLTFKYDWDRRTQNNLDDEDTDFIYQITDFDAVVDEVNNRLPNDARLRQYAMNRWFNFWHARAVEHMFCSLRGVTPHPNPYEHSVDFTIQGIRFDHKSTNFPVRFPHSFQDAKRTPATLIRWLYDNQSKQGRHHYKNRLFLVFHAKHGQHWQLKADLGLIQPSVEKYVQTFTPDHLHSFDFGLRHPTLSDILWITD